MSKHNRWDEINPTTYAWTLGREIIEKSKPAKISEKIADKSATIEEKIETFDSNYVFLKGEVIVFEQQISESYPIPFGLGVVIDHAKGGLVKFQWMGNSHNNEKGKWEPCWFQANEAKRARLILSRIKGPKQSKTYS